MNIQAALIPHKHVRFCDSIVAIAGFIRTLLIEPRTIDELWTIITQPNSGWLTQPPFEYLVYAIDTLFSLKQIELIEGEARIKLRDAK